MMAAHSLFNRLSGMQNLAPKHGLSALITYYDFQMLTRIRSNQQLFGAILKRHLSGYPKGVGSSPAAQSYKRFMYASCLRVYNP